MAEPRPNRLVSWVEGVDRLLAIDAATRERADQPRTGIKVTTDEHGARTLTVTEHDLAYVLAQFADEMLDRGYAEASRPSRRSDDDKETEVGLSRATEVGPVAASLLSLDTDDTVDAATDPVTTVLQSLADLTHTRYDCDCQVGGVDARSIDADYLAAVARDARDLILTLAGHTTDAGVLAGQAAKVALAAETLDRIYAIVDPARSEAHEHLDDPRVANRALRHAADQVHSLIREAVHAGIAFTSQWEPKVEVTYGTPTDDCGTYEIHSTLEHARIHRDGIGSVTGKVAPDAPPILRITTVEVHEPNRGPKHLRLRPATED